MSGSQRRRVFVTRGLAASAAVLAMGVQAGAGDDGVVGSAYGDAAQVQVDQVDQSDGPGDETASDAE